MAREQVFRTVRPVDETDVSPAPQHALGEFASEFRTLARQRRFERDAAERPGPDQAGVRAARRAEHAPQGAPRPAGQFTERLSQDPSAAMMELSRMADRLIEARDAVAVERARAERAEGDSAAAAQRILAARGLVQEAQRTAQLASERCAWSEGRCEALEEALDLALNSSWWQRTRWKREARASQRAAIPSAN